MKKYNRIVLLLLVFVMVAGSFALAAEDQELKELSVFIGDARPDYPGSTILGDIIREETGVKLDREYLVGDLETKIGLMIASGEYPDMVYAAHFSQRLVDSGVLIPLEDLIAEHAPNIQKYYAKHMESLTQEDGHIYMLPQQAIPYGAGERRYPALGFYINKAVLEDAGYPIIKTFDEYFELIENYKEKNSDTHGYVTLFDSWRSFATTNVPQHLLGYPNEGGFIPVKESNEWVLRPFNGGVVEKYYYQKLNEMYNKGVVDPETFVLNYDQYMEKLSSGRVLGTFNQHWQLEQAQNILIKEKPDNIMIPMPIVYDEMIEERMRDTPYIQTTQGMGITTECEDPVAAIKYLDYLVGQQTLIQWGIEGEHYEVDEDGMYYRTEEQLELFRDPDWTRDTFGRHYFYDYFPSLYGVDENGNAYLPDRQESQIYSASTDTEKEVMDAYGIKSFTGLFNDPRPLEEVPYYPVWTITLETGSPEQVDSTRASDLVNEYAPKLVMSETDEFESTWNEYVERVTPLLEKPRQAYQEEVEWRVENWSISSEEE
ncbi:MAG: extracellular solute-binding protein [Halanaerobiaceae bacterium]